ncbi:MAG TPA: GNAT family N-acetyltransferase [Streptosporangiaceae bacterium]|jgi:predicted acetyltransferase
MRAAGLAGGTGQSDGPVTVRELCPADGLEEAALDLQQRAFGPAGDRQRWLAEMRAIVAAGRVLGVLAGQTLLGTAFYHDMRQFWHGKSLPMAGVASVNLAPEHRGRGMGRALMTELLSLIAERGYLLSALYPSTMPLYRSLGWELAGGRYQVVIRARALAGLLAAGSRPAAEAGSPPAIRRAGPQDAAEIRAVSDLVHQAARAGGPVVRDADSIARSLGSEDRYAYLAPDGFLGYRWRGGNSEIMVSSVLAGSAVTARALWQIVGSHATMANTVRAYAGPQDAVGWLTSEPDVDVVRVDQWMLRVIDAPGAIAARGYPAAISLRVPVQLDDDACAANSGQWLLEVSGGQGALTRAGERAWAAAGATVLLGARGLGALFAGTPVAALRLAGLVAGGDPAADDALDSAFGPPAAMADFF